MGDILILKAINEAMNSELQLPTTKTTIQQPSLQFSVNICLCVFNILSEKITDICIESYHIQNLTNNRDRKYCQIQDK